MISDSFVYCWSDHATSKVYVGVHKGALDDGYVCSSLHTLKEYNARKQDFTREILFSGALQDCAKFEVAVIKAMRKMPDTCYNRNYGGVIFNDAITMAKIGKKVQHALTGRKRPAAVGKAISIAKSGVALTEAHRQALSLAQTGKKRAPEVCAKLSVALKGCNTRPKTADEKEKIKAAVKKLWEDPAYRQRVLLSRAAKKAEVLA
jgi:hypothetical protein